MMITKKEEEKRKEVVITHAFKKLFIMPECMKRITYYTEAADGEVSGLGTIKKDEKGLLIIDKVFLLDQECSGADTEIKPEAIHNLMYDLIKIGDDPGRIKFWWHSHDNMNVFWSGTDHECVEGLSNEFAASLVVNKHGDRLCRLDIYTPIRITLDNVVIKEIIENDIELKEKCVEEVKQKVKSAYRYTRNFKNDYYDQYDYDNDYNGVNNINWVNKLKDSKINIDENLLDDIKRLDKISEDRIVDGGCFSGSTWTQFVYDTFMAILNDRFKGAYCKQFATYVLDGEPASLCKNCTVAKECQYWSKIVDLDIFLKYILGVKDEQKQKTEEEGKVEQITQQQ